MAARLNRRHQDSVREKIKASQIINRLTDHALGNLEKPMDATQVSAGLGLLRKCVPDLSNMELTGKDGEAIKVEKIERLIVKP